VLDTDADAAEAWVRAHGIESEEWIRNNVRTSDDDANTA
jgi:hypothetical protein